MIFFFAFTDYHTRRFMLLLSLQGRRKERNGQKETTEKLLVYLSTRGKKNTKNVSILEVHKRIVSA